ncbi:MAG TPA: preprotein translocase subunit SecG [Candidatus Ruthenibacterium merdavium]|uniref:Protein-export membrane protein SecG n=1 Tax=Candidatus Ruthenibacterium merdavium TaxID=2838752 RepID=A0A9D2Q6F1_9FIRM|nr:preprotein translocase subunit SecG [Candidatus Ruthenibacterium merdavium]
MGIFEIIGGVLLILCCIGLIFLVLSQESKGRGLSGVIGGGEMVEDNRGRMGSSVLAKYTKYAGIAFFVLAVLVSVFSIYLA